MHDPSFLFHSYSHPINALAMEEAELAEWEDDPPEVVSFEVLAEP
jgi:hypothetical protein